MIRKLSNDDIRSQVSEALSYDVPNKLWTYLLKERYIEELLAGERTLAQLMQHVDKMTDIFSPLALRATGAKRARTEEDHIRMRSADDSRYKAIEALVARDAASRPDVRAFRQQVLGGHQLEPEDVIPWLDRQALADGQSDLWIINARVAAADRDKVPAAWQQTLEQMAQDSRRRPKPFTVTVEVGPAPGRIVRQVGWRMLRCKVAVDASSPFVYQGIYQTAVKAGGVCDRLRRLARRLAVSCSWTEASAANFVLTGGQPVVAQIKWKMRLAKRLPVSSRIILTIDPSVKPSEVAECYTFYRQQFLTAKARKLSYKHVELARFATSRPTNETWAARMEAWNQAQTDEHPTWRYSRATNFARDARQAEKRLLYPAYSADDSRRWLRVKRIP